MGVFIFNLVLLLFMFIDIFLNFFFIPHDNTTVYLLLKFNRLKFTCDIVIIIIDEAKYICA